MIVLLIKIKVDNRSGQNITTVISYSYVEREFGLNPQNFFINYSNNNNNNIKNTYINYYNIFIDEEKYKLQNSFVNRFYKKHQRHYKLKKLDSII